MKRTSALFIVLALLAGACGSRGSDNSGGVGGGGDGGGGGSATTAPKGETASAGDWGDLKAVCGPKEGGGAVPADDAQGISADGIEVGTVSDPGFVGQPGLNQEIFDAGDAFVEWCNAAGGINGKKLKLNKHDAKLTDYQPVITDACKTDFGLVGGGAVQDNLWPDVGAKCGLFDVAGFAVTSQKAGKAGDTPMEGRTVQPLPNPSDTYPVGPAKILEKDFPDMGQRVGFLAADFQTLTEQRNKEAAGYESIDYKVVHDGTYGVTGEANWKPFATAFKDANVKLYKFVGEPVNAAKVDQAFSQIGFTPEVRLHEPNIYDDAYIKGAGPAANGAFVGLSFVPLEEADTHPATQQYLDILKKQGGKTAVLGVQSTSAWLLFATLAKQCDLDGDLTRTCILKGASQVKDWTGGGLHAPTSPGTNEGATCWMVITVKDEKFVRYAPKDEDYTCDPSFQAKIDPKG